MLTPHLGYVTEDTYDAFFGDAVEDVLAYLVRRPRPRHRALDVDGPKTSM